uniref:Uncharacterized protein n=1 Tax=Solanum tuberosum TaxID=4113 RepID=M1AYW0_SOLTU
MVHTSHLYLCFFAKQSIPNYHTRQPVHIYINGKTEDSKMQQQMCIGRGLACSDPLKVPI